MLLALVKNSWDSLKKSFESNEENHGGVTLTVNESLALEVFESLCRAGAPDAGDGQQGKGQQQWAQRGHGDAARPSPRSLLCSRPVGNEKLRDKDLGMEGEGAREQGDFPTNIRTHNRAYRTDFICIKLSCRLHDWSDLAAAAAAA